MVGRQQPALELFGHAASYQLLPSIDIQVSHFDVSSEEFGDKPKGKNQLKTTHYPGLAEYGSQWVNSALC